MFRTILRCLLIAYWSVLTVGKDVEALRNDLSAAKVSAIFPDDPGYANASLAYNRRIKVHPAVIVIPTTVKQVSDAVKAGAAQRLRVVALSGGHSYLANGLGGKDGALVVDLSNFKKITVNADKNTAVVGTGSRLGEVTEALNAKGKALPLGTCLDDGIGGHAGYGGFGFMSRLWGLTLDNTVSATVVLADGKIVKATSTKNSDLFWAIRGSAGSYGILTSLKFNIFDAPKSVTTFNYVWTFETEAIENALKEFQKFALSDVPAELGAAISISGSSGEPVRYEFLGAYYGPEDQFDATVAPYLKTLPEPTTSVQHGTYMDSVNNLPEISNPKSRKFPDSHDSFYASSLMTSEETPLSDDKLESLVEYVVQENPGNHFNWFVQFDLCGGRNSKINSVPLNATAFAHRSSLFLIQFFASSLNHEPPFPRYGRKFVDGIGTFIINNYNDEAYPGYLEDIKRLWQDLYYRTNIERLRKIKNSVDPNNVFKFFTSIEPVKHKNKKIEVRTRRVLEGSSLNGYQ